MTGFGAAEGPVLGGRLRMDVRTVNHRHLQMQLKVPDELLPLEGELREALRSAFDRGHVTVTARWIETPEAFGSIGVNIERAREVVSALRELQTALGLSGEVDVALVARQPDVLAAREGERTEVSWKDIAPIVQRAIAPVQQSREREGAALVAELERRIGNLQEGLAKVEERSPERAARERDRLREAINTLAAGVTVDETRLAQEVAILADRIDITEETVRLRTHIDAVHHALNEAGPVGKQLGFLGQEMLRETNTIGSKANDAQIAQLVIAMKGELEKYREQLENIE